MALSLPTTLAGGSWVLRGLGLLVACSAASAFAALPSSDLGSVATLDQLVGQANYLTSPDGTLVLSDFAFTAAGTAAPVASEIELQLTTSPDALNAVLQVSIAGSSQILLSGDDYGFWLSYTLENLDPELDFSQVSLDIEAGTVGTAGTGRIQVAGNFAPDPVVLDAVFAEPQSPEHPMVRVFNDGDNGQLLKQTSPLIPPASKLNATIQVLASGGSDGQSGAVLTDFSIGVVRSERIPEPSTLCCVAVAMMAGAALRRTVKT